MNLIDYKLQHVVVVQIKLTDASPLRCFEVDTWFVWNIWMSDLTSQTRFCTPTTNHKHFNSSSSGKSGWILVDIVNLISLCDDRLSRVMSRNLCSHSRWNQLKCWRLLIYKAATNWMLAILLESPPSLTLVFLERANDVSTCCWPFLLALIVWSSTTAYWGSRRMSHKSPSINVKWEMFYLLALDWQMKTFSSSSFADV